MTPGNDKADRDQAALAIRLRQILLELARREETIAPSEAAEVGFNEAATLDDSDLWPTVYAVTAMNPAVEKKLTALVKEATR